MLVSLPSNISSTRFVLLHYGEGGFLDGCKSAPDVVLATGWVLYNVSQTCWGHSYSIKTIFMTIRNVEFLCNDPMFVCNVCVCWSYLTLDASEAACAGLRVTEESAVAATVFPGHPDGPELMFLLHIDLLDSGWAQQSTPLLSGQWLKEKVFIHLCVINIQVIIRDVVQRESIGLLGLHRAVIRQLRTIQKVKYLHSNICVTKEPFAYP